MKEFLWQRLAWLVSRPRIADYLIERSKKTPYFNLPDYMNRWWLFNGYAGLEEEDEAKRHDRKYKWLPSVRIHHILRADTARDVHNHPWDARTIILKGGYLEQRPDSYRFRWPGDTASIKHTDFHSIDYVTNGGVWTMFFTWEYQHTWGFLVDGTVIPWREYEEQA